MPTKPLDDDFEEEKLFAPTPQIAMETFGIPQTKNANPLLNYYRVPGLHISLPTRGAFLPFGSFEMTMGDDIPVLPMKTADEMLLKSPDALMNGYAIEQLIRSCVPSIKFPRFVSTPDLDVILLAIRAATYGDTMTVNSVCPKCGHTNSLDCHLPSLLATTTYIEPENPVRLSDEVIVYIRPYNLANATKAALASFEETRKMQALEEASDEDKNVQLNKSMTRLSNLTIAMIADCVIKVVVPNAEVIDREQIKGFIENINKTWVQKIEEKLKEINSHGVNKKIQVVCEGVNELDSTPCNNSWTAEVEFDPANFFVGTFSK